MFAQGLFELGWLSPSPPRQLGLALPQGAAVRGGGQIYLDVARGGGPSCGRCDPPRIKSLTACGACYIDSKQIGGSEIHEKGRFGFYPWLYPLLAFLFAILGQPVLCLLVAGFAIAAEQHAWAARQSIQALLLGVASSLISVVLNTLSGLFYAMPVVGSYLGRAFDVIDSLVWVAILVFAIVAIARGCSKGRTPTSRESRPWPTRPTD